MLRPLLIAALIAGPAAAIRPANPASDQIAAYPDLQRRGVMRGIIVDAGLRCPHADSSALQGGWRNLMMWRVRCDPKDPRYDYAVFIGPDSTAQVRPCPDMVELKLPPCRPLIRRERRAR